MLCLSFSWIVTGVGFKAGTYQKDFVFRPLSDEGMTFSQKRGEFLSICSRQFAGDGLWARMIAKSRFFLGFCKAEQVSWAFHDLLTTSGCITICPCFLPLTTKITAVILFPLVDLDSTPLLPVVFLSAAYPSFNTSLIVSVQVGNAGSISRNPENGRVSSPHSLPSIYRIIVRCTVVGSRESSLDFLLTFGTSSSTSPDTRTSHERGKSLSIISFTVGIGPGQQRTNMMARLSTSKTTIFVFCSSLNHMSFLHFDHYSFDLKIPKTTCSFNYVFNIAVFFVWQERLPTPSFRKETP